MVALWVLIFSICSFSVSAVDTPIFVAELFRHGIRSPQPVQYDSSWKTNGGYSELTDVGIRQQFTLGTLIGQNYPSLFTPFDYANLYIMCTSDNRTISSALTQLYGIYNGKGPNMPAGYPATSAYPPYNSPDVATIDSSIGTPAAANNFRPIPVHTVERNNDYILESYLNCQNANPWFQSMNTDSTVTGLYNLMNNTVASLTSKGLSITGYSDFNDLGDTVIADNANNKPLPGGITASSPEYRDLAFYTQWYNIYASLSLPTQKQWFSGPFLYTVLNYIKNVQSGKMKTKFAFFAAKENMLATILAAFDVMTPECLRANWEAQVAGQSIPYPACKYPIFGSNILFEFYNTSDPYVVVKYNGDTLNLCSGQPTCRLSDFQALVDTVTDKTDLGAFQQKCGNNLVATPVMYPSDEWIPATWALLGVSIALFVLTIGLTSHIIIIKHRMRKVYTKGPGATQAAPQSETESMSISTRY